MGRTPCEHRQIVERAFVAPANQLRAGQLTKDLEWPVGGQIEGRLESSPGQPVDRIALANLDVAQVRSDRRRHVGGQGPGRGGPDQERLAGPVDQGQLDRQAGIIAIAIALGHLVLAHARSATGAPGHGVVALVQPAAPVAFGQEPPDQVVVLVAECEVRAPQLRHAQAADQHLHRIGHRTGRTIDGDLGRGIGRQHIAQAAELIGIVPVHPHPEPDRLLGLARGEGQDTLLAQADELGDAVGLDVALVGQAQVALDVDLHPQALAIEPVLVALVVAEHRPEALEDVLVGPAPGMVDAHRVVGRDRAIEKAPARPAGVLRAQAGERPAITPAGEHLVLGADEIGLAADGSKHRTSVDRLEPALA